MSKFTTFQTKGQPNPLGLEMTFAAIPNLKVWYEISCLGGVVKQNHLTNLWFVRKLVKHYCFTTFGCKFGKSLPNLTKQSLVRTLATTNLWFVKLAAFSLHTNLRLVWIVFLLTNLRLVRGGCQALLLYILLRSM